MRRRRLTLPSVELPLTGLLTEPDPIAVLKVNAFDELPSSLRRRVVDCPFGFPTESIRRYLLSHGEATTVRHFDESVVVERRRFARDRVAALEWAGRTFAIRGLRR